VSRLVPYKKVDLAIEVFNQLGWKLKIVGSGSEKKSLKQMARDNIELVGELTELELLSYYQECTGLLVCQEEDFGLVSLEAQACGKPVLAFNKGGAAETVINGKTGLLFEKQSVTSLREALEKFKTREFSSKVCRENALKYNRDNFKKNFLREINKLWEHKNLKITT
ncbi:glycosyltransferase, partial [Candidatus Gottesmanbacteria bacterium]|nr:glycosyltransferase [Candidatus Gottesmanbacteria bacterium]